MRCYKVLYRDWDDRLLSIGEAFNHPDKLIIEYAPGERTIAPEGTRLFIFNTYNHAKQFAEHAHHNHNNSVEIWEVEANLVIDVSLVAMVCLARTYNTHYPCLIHSYWYKQLNNLAHLSTVVPAPIGTLACGSVILKKRVS